MERRARKGYPVATYPQDPTFMDRRGFLGLTLGAASVVTLSACGLGPVPEDRVYVVNLPPLPAQRDLQFSGGDALRYSVEVTVLGYALSTWLEQNADNLLPATDQVLLSHAFADFAAGADFTAVQEELKAVLADAYHGQANSDTTEFVQVVLTVTTPNTTTASPR